MVGITEVSHAGVPGDVPASVLLLTELRVVVPIEHTLEKASVSIVFNRLRAAQGTISSVRTHLILSVCVPI
jgi:hypothetical protein